RLCSVGVPELLDELPVALGLGPFSPYLEVYPARLGDDGGSLVAGDLGGDHSDWHEQAWYRRRTGQPSSVTTDPADTAAVLVESLREKAIDWARSALPPDHGLIVPELLEVVAPFRRQVGR